MSMTAATRGATALAAPLRRPAETERPRLAPAPSAVSRRIARPRLVHAVITLGGIAVILLGQLMLSIATADGAYTIAGLQAQQKDLLREQQALQESLDVLESPQYLSANAEKLGMVASGSLPYIDLAGGDITGKRTDDGSAIVGNNGEPIGNVLLTGVTTIDATDRTGATVLNEAVEAPDPAADTPTVLPNETETGSAIGLGTGGAGSGGSGASVTRTGDADVSSDPDVLDSPITR